MDYNEAIIISDIHLGSDNCQAELLLEFLDNINTSKLIINGDLFDNTESRLKKKQWKVLSKLRKLSDTVEIIWVIGNHDYPHPEVIGQLIGAKVADDHTFVSGLKTIHCIHGDIWDSFLTKYPMITSIADFIYNILQKIDKKHRLASFAKRSSKSFLRCKDVICENAKKYAASNKYDFIICGHTHYTESSGSYYNSGCWTELPCDYISINNGELVQHVIDDGHGKNTLDH